MLELLLESKYCLQVAYYNEYVIMKDLNQSNYIDYATKLKIGFINEGVKKEFLVPRIRSSSNDLLIHTYRKNNYQPKDKITIGDSMFTITDVSINFETYGKKIVRHYFISIK